MGLQGLEKGDLVALAAKAATGVRHKSLRLKLSEGSGVNATDVELGTGWDQ